MPRWYQITDRFVYCMFAAVILVILAALAIPAFMPGPGTPLTRAIKKGDLAKVEALLDRKPELINMTRLESTLPLHYAAQIGRAEAVKLLVSRGADVNREFRNKTPLVYAAMGEHPEILELLFSLEADPESGGRKALREAAYNGDMDSVLCLLEWGVDPLVEDDGAILLRAAASRGHSFLFFLLLDAGADYRQISDTGATMLHAAAEGGNPRIVRFCLDHGFDVNARARHGRRPIHDAMVLGSDRAEVVAMLIDAGAEVNLKAYMGHTPLHWAAMYGHDRAIKLLLDHGADINARTYDGKTSLAIAIEYHKPSTAQLLKDRGATE